MKDEEIRKKMNELMKPVDEAIMFADNEQDLLALACAMMASSKRIFDTVIGVEGRKKMFSNLT
jgi:hypothetical protein